MATLHKLSGNIKCITAVARLQVRLKLTYGEVMRFSITRLHGLRQFSSNSLINNGKEFLETMYINTLCFPICLVACSFGLIQILSQAYLMVLIYFVFVMHLDLLEFHDCCYAT